MTSWETLGVLRDIFIQYYFGSPVMFYTSIIIIFILALSLAGLELKLAIVFSLPLVAAFALNGIFGEYTWVNNIFLLLIAFIYGFALMELIT